MKLAKNFHKAYSFLFAAATTATAIALDIFAVVPPELFGEHGLKIAAAVSATVAILRVLPQPDIE